jgi:hypothetical protein
MIGEYSCPYLCNTGKTCNNPCIRPEGCRFHWKAKKRVPCPDCGKPTSSACGRCPLHVKGYYVTQYYNRLRSERTFEQIMVAHRDRLAILNITLCKECFLPIKMDEGEYCDNCRPE